MAGDPISIVCAADANYGPWAGVMLGSALRANPGETFHLHLLSDGIRQRDLRRMAAMVSGSAALLHVYNVRLLLDAEGGRLGGSHHLTRAAYARLFVDRLLPPDVARILYLDCDVVVRAPLRPLWAMGEGLALLAAAREAAATAERRAALGMPADAPCFNSGVLLVDLAAWRRQEVSARLLDFVLRYPERIRSLDQDAINAVLWRDAIELPERWNLQLNEVPSGAVTARLAEAAIVHFNGRVKPWQAGYAGPAPEIFAAAKRASPWKWQPPDFRLRARLKRALGKRLARRSPSRPSATMPRS